MSSSRIRPGTGIMPPIDASVVVYSMPNSSSGYPSALFFPVCMGRPQPQPQKS